MQIVQHLLIVKDIFVKALIINLAWSKVKIFLTPLWFSCIHCFSNYTDATRKILGFGKYKDIPPKDNEGMWRASEVVNDYDLSIVSHLDPCNDEKRI